MVIKDQTLCSGLHVWACDSSLAKYFTAGLKKCWRHVALVIKWNEQLYQIWHLCSCYIIDRCKIQSGYKVSIFKCVCRQGQVNPPGAPGAKKQLWAPNDLADTHIFTIALCPEARKPNNSSVLEYWYAPSHQLACEHKYVLEYAAVDFGLDVL